jgi:hypothetical protein
MLATMVLHALAVLLWRALHSTSKRPLPAFLSSPVLETLVGNALVLPLALSSAVLLCQSGSYGRQALGCVGMAALLLWVSLVAASMVAVHRRRQQLGLSYVRVQGGRAVPEGGPVAGWLPAATQRLLLRFFPSLSSGYWDVPGLQQQERLRQGYEGERGACGVLWAAAVMGRQQAVRAAAASRILHGPRLALELPSFAPPCLLASVPAMLTAAGSARSTCPPAAFRSRRPPGDCYRAAQAAGAPHPGAPPGTGWRQPHQGEGQDAASATY